MENSLSRKFIDCLKLAEDKQYLGCLVDLFHDSCTLSNLVSDRAFQGKTGAQQFWTAYLENFGDVHSEFTHVIEDSHTIVLEWTSHGHLKNGQALRYDGVSLLEVENGLITRFRSYYDSAALLRHTTPKQTA